MPSPFGSVIHKWAKYAVGKNAALMTNSTKQALNNAAGIAPRSEIDGTGTGTAMGCPCARAQPRLSINKADRLEEILRFAHPRGRNCVAKPPDIDDIPQPARHEA